MITALILLIPATSLLLYYTCMFPDAAGIQIEVFTYENSDILLYMPNLHDQNLKNLLPEADQQQKITIVK